MRTTNGHLMHLMIALGALVLAMTTATRVGVTVPVTSATPASVEDALPAGVVVDDGVPF